MKIIRIVLGALILFFDRVFPPRGMKRPASLQAKIDALTANFTLYEFESCPFCVKVRRCMKRNSLNIERRDAKRDPASREELLNGGGKVKVPCLRIREGDSVRWLYESGDIIKFLESSVESVAS